MSSKEVFLIGMVGAMAPEIVRLYQLRTRPSQFKWSWFYVLVSILFACLGGTIALALPATSYWGALYAGISTPVLINAVLQKAIGSGRRDENQLKSLTRPEPSLQAFLSGIQ